MNEDPQKLEDFVHRLAREQPLRRAPASLETRVLAQLALRHASAAWWRKGFTQWPLIARVAFLIASFGFIRLALAGVMFVTSFFSSREAAGSAILHEGADVVSACVSMGDFLLHAIPPSWLYGAAAAGFLLYAMLFGLGAFAYRTLYLER